MPDVDVVALAVLAAATAAHLLLRGRARFWAPVAIAGAAALWDGVDEWRGEGPWFALFEMGMIVAAGLAPLAAHGLVRLVRAHHRRLLQGLLALCVAGGLAAGVTALAALNALHVQRRCERLVQRRQTPYRALRTRLARASLLLPVRCEQHERYQVCRAWSPFDGFAACAADDDAGTAAPPVTSG